MKIKCKKCGAIVEEKKNTVCPECFEILELCDEDYEEIIEDENEENKLKLTKPEPKPEKVGTLIGKLFWIVILIFVALSVAFTIVNSTKDSGYKKLLNTVSNTYETGIVDEYIKLLPKEYIDCKTVELGGKEEFNKYITKKFSGYVNDSKLELGDDYKVEHEIVTTDEYNSDEVIKILKELPYAIAEIDVDKIENVEILFEFSNDTKRLKYRKNLILAEIKDKWYILNADNQ